MAQIEDENGFTDFQDYNSITQWQDDDGDLLGTGLAPTAGPVFPISLMLRLRIHACWLTFLILSVSHTT